MLGDRERRVLARVGEVGEDPGHLDAVARVAHRRGQRVHALGQRAEAVQARVDLEMDARSATGSGVGHRAQPVGVQHADVDAGVDQRIECRGRAPAHDQHAVRRTQPL